MAALLALFIQYLPSLMSAGQEIYDYVQKVREAAKQSGEWTDEQEQAFNAELQALKDNPPDWWKPEA